MCSKPRRRGSRLSRGREWVEIFIITIIMFNAYITLVTSRYDQQRITIIKFYITYTGKPEIIQFQSNLQSNVKLNAVCVLTICRSSSYKERVCLAYGKKTR